MQIANRELLWVYSGRSVLVPGINGHVKIPKVVQVVDGMHVQGGEPAVKVSKLPLHLIDSPVYFL